jgi:AmpE protein
MILISLLIALGAERYLSTPIWQFHTYYNLYLKILSKNTQLNKLWQSEGGTLLLVFVPVTVLYIAMWVLDNSVLDTILSTLILIVCLGSFTTRKAYKNYLTAAFRGDQTTSKLYHEQLLSDKNLPDMSFAQALIWLNYRHYVAIMMFFILFGISGAVFYRLVCTIVDKQITDRFDHRDIDEICDEACTQEAAEAATANEDIKVEVEIPTCIEAECYIGCQKVLFWLDWLPVRITSFGYMFVGHFSKALPIWLESIFDIKKASHDILGDVAKESEDVLLDDKDCTAEPCLLVRLAKRNILLVLAVVAVLTLTGIIS